jgi:hypothetical protein
MVLPTKWFSHLLEHTKHREKLAKNKKGKMQESKRNWRHFIHQPV